MIAERLIPERPTPRQCEGVRVTPYLIDRGDDPYRCERTATFRVDGHYYCKAHAGHAALMALLSENRTQEKTDER